MSNSSKTILNIYQVDGFEGGSNSIENFLKKQAIKFNKKHRNCYILVTSMSVEQMVLNIRNNNLPDIFSFSLGAGQFLSGFLLELSKNKQIDMKLQDFSLKNNKILAYPYIMSAYSLISHQEFGNLKDEIIPKGFMNVKKSKKEIRGLSTFQQGYFSPLNALKMNKISLNKENLYNSTSFYDAYANFICKNTTTILGTCRDVIRCKNREKNGQISGLDYMFLNKYTDLIQYIGIVSSNNKIKESIGKEFLNFILSNECQQDISNFGLFSITKGNIYKDDYMSSWEKTLKSTEISSINVFSNDNEIKNLKLEIG